jgi:hypothetical protein
MKRTGLGHAAFTSTALLASTLIVLTLAGCASAPEVGVRPAFEQRQVPRIAVVPFYSLGTFSLSNAQITEVMEASEASAVESLRASGFEVIEPRAFRQHLVENDATTLFDDGVMLRSELANYFEPAHGGDTGPDLEVTTVRELYEQGKLPAEALLFGEVVYHTRTNCRVDPTPHNEHAEILGASSVNASDASECVVSHFQAKLVHAPTGETMWFNRRLLQTYTAEGAPEADQQNLAQTVTRTLGGSDGLAAFRGESEERTAALDGDEKEQTN